MGSGEVRPYTAHVPATGFIRISRTTRGGYILRRRRKKNPKLYNIINIYNIHTRYPTTDVVCLPGAIITNNAALH